jgi:hypothetical protein
MEHALHTPSNLGSQAFDLGEKKFLVKKISISEKIVLER